MNTDSPTTERLSAPINPPLTCDCSSTFTDIETMAPDSAWIVCSF
jgi:hypothetical protein